MNPIIKKAILGSFSVLIALLLCFSLFLLYIEKSNNMVYKEINITQVEYTISRPESATRENIKDEIDKLFGNKNYRLVYKDFERLQRGSAKILFREISLDNKLSLEEFVFSLTHELVHINYFTKSERFCNLRAFEILYNSGSEYFKNIALMFAQYDILGAFDEEYSFVGYIENIL